MCLLHNWYIFYSLIATSYEQRRNAQQCPTMYISYAYKYSSNLHGKSYDLISVLPYQYIG